MMFFRLSLLLFSTLVLTSCATPYQEESNPFNWAGGYASSKPLGNVEKVFFYGNGYTSVELANNYAVRRAAELAKLKHKPYFAIYQTLNDVVENNKSQYPLTDVFIGKPIAEAYIVYDDHNQRGDFVVSEILNNYKNKGA